MRGGDDLGHKDACEENSDGDEKACYAYGEGIGRGLEECNEDS